MKELVDSFVSAACIPIDRSHTSGNLDRARAIVAEHPEVASADIYAAAILGNDSAVRQFLQADRTRAVKKGGLYGWDALTYLAFSRYLRLDKSRSDGFIRSAVALLQCGADPNTGFYSEEHLPSPTFESALYGAAGVAHHAELTKVLLEHGADPNDGETEYHSPEWFDNRPMELIVESGRLKPTGVVTMLHRKLDWTDLPGVMWLLDHGANPNLLSNWGQRALDHAIACDNHIRFLEVLLDHGADPTLAASDGANAFVHAALAGRADVLELFERRGFSTVLENDAQFLAECARGNGEAAHKLAADDPEILERVKAERPNTLAYFAGSGNTRGVKILLDMGFDIESRSELPGSQGNTALHLAIWRERLDTVRLLMERGASLSATNARGDNALALAERAQTEMSEWTPHETRDVLELVRSSKTAD